MFKKRTEIRAKCPECEHMHIVKSIDIDLDKGQIEFILVCGHRTTLYFDIDKEEESK